MQAAAAHRQRRCSVGHDGDGVGLAVGCVVRPAGQQQPVSSLKRAPFHTSTLVMGFAVLRCGHHCSKMRVRALAVHPRTRHCTRHPQTKGRWGAVRLGPSLSPSLSQSQAWGRRLCHLAEWWSLCLHPRPRALSMQMAPPHPLWACLSGCHPPQALPRHQPLQGSHQEVSNSAEQPQKS